MSRTQPHTRSHRTPLSTVALAWTTLIVNVVVILQGAVVRATGSGAGCGRHWPMCNGEVVPLAPSTATMIEFSHRLLSLAALFFGAWLLSRAWRARTDNPGLFRFALLAFGFLVVEALLGAATVLLEYTGDNVSMGRGIMVAVHLVNSLLLVGTLTGSLLYARARRPRWPLRLAEQGSLATVLGVGLVAMLTVMFTGGLAALGNTMFPSESLAQGLAADFDPRSHPIIRLRILHPTIAIAVGIYLFLSLGLGWWLKPVRRARPVAQALLTVYLVQLVIGTLNLAFLAPIVLQILHLGVAVLAFALLSTLAIALLGHERAADPAAEIDEPGPVRASAEGSVRDPLASGGLGS